MDYFDTSVLVTLLTNESGRTETLTEWFDRRPFRTRAISPWVVAEFSSAVAQKKREGVLNVAGRAEALASFTSLRQNFRMLAITSKHHLDAAHMVDSARNLRAPDALHLAIARDVGAQLWTFDAGMVRAAEELSLLAAIPAL